ncbi:uncharacterized protein LOC126897015 isoform X2 [Daktulosphaira vitifoliae]|uniref:uncharacterized protein LOC126897015 isoform X2 n=1 Tax=Daktulosphaira vitifoliae TaxID=58002 RepID=UPI0021AA0179|nr:uncharacterized protein LOC126897015 isoform X2 [Daktulosphaira vitifoliae]
MKIFLLFFLAVIRSNQISSFIIGDSLLIKLLKYNSIIDNQRNTIDQLLVNFAEHFKNNIANQSTVLYLNDIHLVNVENIYMNVNATLSNVEVNGFDKIEILNVTATVFDGNKWIITFNIPDLEFKANYSLSGDLKLDSSWITNNTIVSQSAGIIKTHLYNVTSVITTTLDVDLLSRNVKIQNVSVDYNYREAKISWDPT